MRYSPRAADAITSQNGAAVAFCLAQLFTAGESDRPNCEPDSPSSRARGFERVAQTVSLRARLAAVIDGDGQTPLRKLTVCATLTEPPRTWATPQLVRT